MSETHERRIVVDDPTVDSDWDGRTATEAQAEASDAAEQGLILIDAEDGDVVSPGSWEHQNRPTVTVWID